MKALWLCSWYPSQEAPFNGDFVQRHAYAAATQMDVHVIHVAGFAGVERKFTNETVSTGRLTEQVIYIKQSGTFLGKLSFNYQLQEKYRKAIKEYIGRNGVPDVIHVHGIMKAGIAAVWAKQKWGCPYIITEHWGIYNSFVTDNFLNRSHAFRHFTKRVIQEANGFLSVSRFIAKGINSMVTSKKYEVLPNTVNTGFFFPQQKLHSPFRFIHVSNIVPLKNVEGIIRSFKDVHTANPQTELHIVGDTDIAIREFNINHGAGNGVVFHGEVSYKQVAQLMQQADCLVLFSDIENSPCVIGEALCCGLPVIATNVGGVPELVDESNSLLVSPRRNEELIAAMNTVCHATSFDKNKIAESAKNKFSYEVIGRQMADYYQKTRSAGF